MTSYQEILEDLCQRTEASESPESLRKVLSKYEATGISVNAGNGIGDTRGEKSQEKEKTQDAPQLLPFHPGGLTDLIVTRMMTVSTEPETENSISKTTAMNVAKALVECLPGVYLHSLATSVSDLVALIPHEKLSIGNNDAPGLLRLWISLITHSPLAVHELLSESFLTLVGKQQIEEHATDALNYLVDDWKAHRDDASKNKNSSSSSSSSEAVRCAVFLVKWISRLPLLFFSLAKSSGATDLFCDMLGDFDDPLTQLSLLDALMEEFDGTTTITSTRRTTRRTTTRTTNNTVAVADEWLASPPLMSLVLQFLKVPLLCDGALRYVGVLSSVKPTELVIVLDHVQQVVLENEGSIPTRDTERLPLVNALSTVATSSETGLSSILSKEELRRCWWDTDRIAQPKLKAAILVSIAQAIPRVEESFGSSRALELYRLVGEDHHRGRIGDPMTTTTGWILSKMANSPLVEVKIASMALLAAALRIGIDNANGNANGNGNGNGCLALIGFSDKNSHSELLDLLLSPKREPTIHAQSARYDLLVAFFECLKAHPSLEENKTVLKKLNEKLALGPHGQKPLPHGSDEMETA